MRVYNSDATDFGMVSDYTSDMTSITGSDTFLTSAHRGERR
jgi:hypothetical protein